MANDVTEETKNKEEKAKKTYSGHGEASAAEIKDILAAAYPAAIPVLIYGDPGVGKSFMIRDYSVEKFGGPAVTLLLSTMDPTDISGLPVKGEVERDGYTVAVTQYGMPWWQEALLNGKYPDGTPCKVLFLDEFSNVIPTVQASVLALVHDRILPCGEQLPDDVQIIMAANPESSATDYNALAAPMANRILQVSYKPTDEEFYNGFCGAWYDEEVIKSWTENERRWRNRIVDFLKSNHGTYILMMNHLADGAIESTIPAYLQPDSETSDCEREILTSAWASPRSWELAVKVLSNIDTFEKELTPTQMRVLSGLVGRQAAVELESYCHAHLLLNPFDVIFKPELQSWKADATKPGETTNDLLELAANIGRAVADCNGKDGKPGPLDVMNFYEKVVELGGAHLFVNDYCSTEGTGASWLRAIKSDDRPLPTDEWMGRIYDLMIKFKEMDLLAQEKRSPQKI